MKTTILALVAFLLSVVSAAAQQKYMLPIGSNVNNRPAEVSIIISSLDTWARMEDSFSFLPSMGRLEDVVKKRAALLAGRYVVPHGFEQQGEFALNVQVTPGPSSQSIFRFQQSDNGWVVPSKVLDVKLNYGAAVVWYLKGITAITMRVTDASGTTNFSSQDGSGYETPCGLGVTRELLAEGQALVEREYALPEFQKERGITAGSVTLWQNERYASFDLLDGHFLGASASPPDFLESLRAPEMQQSQSQAPVLVANTPRIAKITRILGNATEIVVEGEAGETIAVEFSKKLDGEWTAVSTPLVLTSAGRRIFTHTTDALSCFYRLRSADSSSPQ